MTPSRSFLACALVACAVVLASCGKSEPPPPAKTAAAPAAPVAAPAAPPAPAPAPPAQDPNAAVKRAASELWVYAFPLVLTDVSREAQSAGTPINTFKHRRTIPDATSTDVASPNADILYSQAWLDLSKGPVILTVPETKGRYYLLALLDAYTNVVASIGKRTTGTEKRTFAIVGPGFKGSLPEGTSEVRSPTDLAWIFGRTAVSDKADVANAVKIQDQYKLAGPAQKTAAPPAKGAPAAKGAAPAPEAKGSPRDQVAAMNAAAFFGRVAMLLPGNPPSKEDAPILEKIKLVGITPGKPFDTSKLDPAVVQALDEGIQAAIKAVSGAASGLSGADIRNGWKIDRALGRWGNDYGRRAIAAWNGIGVNAPEDAIFMSSDLGSGKKLDGANRYVLHFDPNQLPPAEAFWSLSLYDDKQRFVANPANRYNLGSGDRLRANADGSVDIVIANADPGRDANWLPAPKGPFNVLLRVYWPKQELIDGRWNPPPIKAAAP